jgi:hypothetical protein
VNCKDSLAFNVRRCKFGWVIGDSGYVGFSRVALYERPNRTRIAVVRYRLRNIDEYCFFALHKPLAACERHRHGVGRVSL